MGESRRGEDGQEEEAETQRRRQERNRTEDGSQEAKGRKEGSGRAGPLTETGGEVRAGAVSRRTDALEGAVGVGTDAALAEVFLAAFINICRTVSKTGHTSSTA